MTVVQDAFFIPEDIATGIATGLYRRIGSVVRFATGPNKGNIVKHLDPIELNATEATQGIAEKALQFVSQHKKESFIVAGCVTAVGVGALAYKKVKNHEPKVVTEFRTALRIYIEAVRNGKIDIEIIDKLMESLEALKAHKNYEKIKIQLTSEELDVLVSRIYEYTIKLIKDNNAELSAEELNPVQMKNAGTIVNLQNYLKVQKKIFETAA